MRITGPFHTALRQAIADRGLSLERLRERLAARGLTVAVSTLSNWQRGAVRPQRPDSLRAVTELEHLLDLPAGALSRLLDDHGPRGRRPLLPGTPPRRAGRLRAQFGAPADSGLDLLTVQQDVTVTGTGFRATVRAVVRARRTGVDRHVVLTHTGGGAVPEIRAGRDCRLGRVRTDPGAALIAAEVLYAPLGRGETFALEYHLTGAEPEPYYGWWFRSAAQHFDLTLRLAPELAADRAYRIWRLDSGTPHKDVAGLRLIDGNLAHLVDFDVPPGFHGIRWSR
ncbi:hypothetical protein [Kitasatospora sp. NPDC002040]|uniref:helix-turn-helix domain-containing protein n=1 Tax=Kitasatospora sp. NPDC002040 TaxID=3154661 RepID=UPI0033267FD4